MSKPRQQLGLLVASLLPSAQEEVRFDPVRRFRFDWADPELMVAVEYEGIVTDKSRHTSVLGYSRDCEKYSLAAIAGWVVVRITAVMVRDGRAWCLINEALKARRMQRGETIKLSRI